MEPNFKLLLDKMKFMKTSLEGSTSAVQSSLGAGSALWRCRWAAGLAPWSRLSPTDLVSWAHDVDCIKNSNAARKASVRPDACFLGLQTGPITCSLLSNQLDTSTELDDAIFPHSASRCSPSPHPHCSLATAASTALPARHDRLH